MIARPWIAGAGLMAALVFAALPLHAAEPLSAQQKQEIEQFVRQLLVDNPDIVIGAIREYQRRQDAAAKTAAAQALSDNREQLFNSPDSPVAGNPEGNVTLVEFFDYQCGYCKSVVDRVADTVENDKNIRWVFKEFPILGPVSVYAAQAALAARRQGKYQEFHLAMMRLKGRLAEERVLQVAEAVGLDVERLQQDMQDPQVIAEIGRNLDLAEALNVRGTPAFVIGEVVVPGAIDAATLRRLIAEARQG
jgi:protein-disulfide isomerase